MAGKDWLSVLFSVCALSVSLLTFYFSNLRVEDNAMIRISDIGIRAGDKDDPNKKYINGCVTTQASFVNAGNRPAIVLSAIYQMSDQMDLNNGGFGSDVVTPQGTFPLVLPPRDIRLVELCIPVGNVLSNFKSGRELSISEAGNRLGVRRFFAGFRIYSLDSLGMQHDSWTGMQLGIDVSENGWEGLKSVVEPKRSLTKLFNSS